MDFYPELVLRTLPVLVGMLWCGGFLRWVGLVTLHQVGASHVDRM